MTVGPSSLTKEKRMYGAWDTGAACVLVDRGRHAKIPCTLPVPSPADKVQIRTQSREPVNPGRAADRQQDVTGKNEPSSWDALTGTLDIGSRGDR